MPNETLKALKEIAFSAGYDSSHELHQCWRAIWEMPDSPQKEKALKLMENAQEKISLFLEQGLSPLCEK